MLAFVGIDSNTTIFKRVDKAMSKPYDYVVLSAKNKVNLKALVLGYNSMGYVCLGGVSVSRSDDEVIYDQAMERVSYGHYVESNNLVRS